MTISDHRERSKKMIERTLGSSRHASVPGLRFRKSENTPSSNFFMFRTGRPAIRNSQSRVAPAPAASSPDDPHPQAPPDPVSKKRSPKANANTNNTTNRDTNNKMKTKVESRKGKHKGRKAKRQRRRAMPHRPASYAYASEVG